MCQEQPNKATSGVWSHLGGGKGGGILSLHTAHKLPAKLVDGDANVSSGSDTVNTAPASACRMLIMLLIQSTVGGRSSAGRRGGRPSGPLMQ